MTDHDLILHVGMPRSSSILGPALSRLRPQLRARGIAYLSAADLARLPHAASWRRTGFTGTGTAADAFAAEVARRARAERQAAGALWRRRPIPLVISGDELLGSGDLGYHDVRQFRPFAASAIGQIAEALAATSVQVIVHTHRQDRLVELAYLRWLRSGRHGSMEVFYPALFEPVLDYRDLLTRLRAVPQVTDLVVRPVELADAGAHAFIDETVESLGLRGELDLFQVGAERPVLPAVYSSRGAALARAMNPIADGSQELDLLRGFLTEKHSAQLEYGAPEILERDDRARMLSMYAEANRDLFTRYMPDLRSDGYLDDVATFDLANAVTQPAARRRDVSARLTVAASVRTNRATVALERNLARAGRRVPPSVRARIAARRG